MTSNLGLELIIDQMKNVENQEIDKVMAKVKSFVFQLLKNTILPEFLNRIDRTILFEPIKRSNINIVTLNLDLLKKQLKKINIELKYAPKAAD